MNEAKLNPFRLSDVFAIETICALSGEGGIPRIADTLVGLMVEQGMLDLRMRNQIVQAVVQRDRLGPTAIGEGLAFPHLRSDLVPRIMGAVGIIDPACNLNSLDGKPTRCVFLTLSPISMRREHGAMLEKLFSLMHDCALNLMLEQKLVSNRIYQHLVDIDDRF